MEERQDSTGGGGGGGGGLQRITKESQTATDLLGPYKAV